MSWILISALTIFGQQEVFWAATRILKISQEELKRVRPPENVNGFINNFLEFKCVKVSQFITCE